MKRMLLTGENVPVHDAYYWELSLFHFFAKNIAQGSLPLWNPYSHGGEPFFPLMIHLKFLDPLALVSVFLGGFLTSSTTLLFNGYRFLQLCVMGIGFSCLLRRYTERVWIRILLIPVIFLSSIFLGAYRQHGVLHLFAWVPYIALLLEQILIEGRTQRFRLVILALLIGINFQSYYFIGVLVFLMLFALGMAWNSGRKGFVFLKKINRTDWGLFVLILSCMSAPNFYWKWQATNFIYPARNLPEDHIVLGQPVSKEGSLLQTSESPSALDLVRETGSFSSPWDLLQLWSPNGNSAVSDLDKGWGWTSENYIFIGILPLWFALWGLCFSKHPLKRLWTFLLIGAIGIILGPPLKVYYLFAALCPPLILLRHTSNLVLFIPFALCYFFAIGIEDFYHSRNKINQWRVKGSFVFISLWVFISGIVYHYNASGYGKYWLLCWLFPLVFTEFLRVSGAKKYPNLIGGVMALAIFGDLVFHLQSKFILLGYPHPQVFTQARSRVEPWIWPKVRTAVSPNSLSYYQSIRYLSLLQELPAALSPLKDEKNYLNDMSLRDQERWNSLFLRSDYAKIVSTESIETLNGIFHIGRDLLSFTPGRTNPSKELWRSSEPIQYKIRSYQPQRIELETENSTPGILVWSDAYDKDWRAVVDGTSREIFRVNHLFKGIYLEKGSHRIKFVYRPWICLLSLILFYLPLFCFCIYWILKPLVFSNDFKFFQIRESTPLQGG